MIALHTPAGIVLYANDFKLDNSPVLGKKPNYDKLKEIAKQGVKVLIVDSLYSGDNRKTASEKVARTLLEDVLFGTTNENSGLFVTTFSSHIARLKSIVEFGKKLDRKLIFLGRSLNKYVSAASRVNLCPFRRDIEIATYRNQLEKKLRIVEKNRGRYMVVCTGHQGEPGSILDRIGKNKLHFKFRNNDHLVFSSSVIPTPVNIENREKLDNRLKKRGVRLFNNVHVSGHAGREDLRDFISLINPEHIIPSHGAHDKITPMIELAEELGYKNRKNAHLINNGQKLTFR
jgi:ribonuclease J